MRSMNWFRERERGCKKWDDDIIGNVLILSCSVDFLCVYISNN